MTHAFPTRRSADLATGRKLPDCRGADVQRPDRQGLSGLGIATWLLRSGVQQGQRIEGNLALLVGRDDHDARAAFSLDFAGNAQGSAGVGFGVRLEARSEERWVGKEGGRKGIF